MFNSITLLSQRPLDPEHPVDIGTLGEALVFYSSVRVAVNRVGLKQLIREVGAETLVRLVDDGFLRLTYLNNGLGVMTVDKDTLAERHQAATFALQDTDAERVAVEAVREVTGRSGYGRRWGMRLAALATQDEFPEFTVSSGRAQYRNEHYMSEAVQVMLQGLIPEYAVPNTTSFVVEEGTDGLLVVRTDLNFEAINRAFHTHVPADVASITPALLLSECLEVEGLLYLGARYESELAATPTGAALVGLRSRDLAGRIGHGADQLARYQEVVLGSATALREAINAGEKQLGDLVPILEESRRFKEWLSTVEKDADVVAEYYKKVGEDTWIQRLPAKVLRWAVVAGGAIALSPLGVGGLVGGVALAAADQLLVEKLLKGWKPNQFVEGDIREWLAGNGGDG